MLFRSDRYLAQAQRNQFETAKKSGAVAAIYYDDGGLVTAKALGGKLAEAPTFQAPVAEILLPGSASTSRLQEFVAGLRPPPRG